MKISNVIFNKIIFLNILLFGLGFYLYFKTRDIKYLFLVYIVFIYR